MYFTRMLFVLILVAPTLLLAFHYQRLVTIDVDNEREHQRSHEHERHRRHELEREHSLHHEHESHGRHERGHRRVSRDDHEETHHNHQNMPSDQHSHNQNHETSKEKFFDYNQKGVNTYDDDIDNVHPMKHHLAPIYGDNSANSEHHDGFSEHHSAGAESDLHHNQFTKDNPQFQHTSGFKQGIHGSAEFGVKATGDNHIVKHVEHIKSKIDGVKTHVHAVKDHLMDKIEQVGKEKSFGKKMAVDGSTGVDLHPEQNIDPRHRH